jgi:hypothetical protein
MRARRWRMGEPFTTVCGHGLVLRRTSPDDRVECVTIAQVWRGPELVAECATHEWARRVADALNQQEQVDAND